MTVHAQPQAPTSNRMMDDIQQAKALFDAGAISDAEFRK
ncbi:SHOCT domain-containing protein [Brevundimonas staleyi]|uniref:SHOCT domain-containing protein n=1 Tax=Brevundimonas staleyi TaxID=74326 RepID=A0ABW0FY39_9CAUL